MHIRHAALAAVAAIGLVTVATTGTASAGVQFDPEVVCGENDINTLIIDFELIGDETDLWEILFEGEPAEAELVPEGLYHYEITPVAEGWFSVVVKNQDGEVELNWGELVACEGPVVETASDCVDNGLIVFVGVFDDSPEWTYDVYIDGVLAESGVPGNAVNKMFVFEGLTAGEHLVEVDWLQDDSDGPYFSGMVSDACADSGAGLPDSGAASAPLLWIGSVLLAAGALLLGGRRLRHA